MKGDWPQSLILAGDPQQTFELIEMIGQGAYGNVWKAIKKQSGLLYAVKILPAASFEQMVSIEKEVSILKLCNSDHIIKYFGSYFKANHIWMILQYCAVGSVSDLLHITNIHLNQQQIASILQSVLTGLHYLHLNKKIHRDVKGANILLNLAGQAKLADFGVAAISQHTNAGHNTHTGSPNWMSPQVIKYSTYTCKTDIWSLGITAIELAEGDVPYSHLKPYMALYQFKKNPIQQLTQPNKWSIQFNNFISQCLQIDPKSRPEAVELIKHPFIIKNSKGVKMLANLAMRSIDQIQGFRINQGRSKSYDDLILAQMFNTNQNDQVYGGNTIISHIPKDIHPKKSQLQTTVNNANTDNNSDLFARTAQSKSKILVEDESSMIQNNDDQHNQSMIAYQDKEIDKMTNQNKNNKSYLGTYIKELQNRDLQTSEQKQKIRTRFSQLDMKCKEQLQLVFKNYKNIVAELVHPELQKDLTSHLSVSKTVNEFINRITNDQSPSAHSQNQNIKYPQLSLAKEIFNVHQKLQSSSGIVKKQISSQRHLSKIKDKDKLIDSKTNTAKNIFANQKEQRQSKQHWNSKGNQRIPLPRNKRFIATQPYQFRDPQYEQHSQNSQKQQNLSLKQFLLDPDVKTYLLGQIQTKIKDQPEYKDSNENDGKFDKDYKDYKDDKEYRIKDDKDRTKDQNNAYRYSDKTNWRSSQKANGQTKVFQQVIEEIERKVYPLRNLYPRQKTNRNEREKQEYCRDDKQEQTQSQHFMNPFVKISKKRKDQSRKQSKNKKNPRGNSRDRKDNVSNIMNKLATSLAFTKNKSQMHK